LSDASSWRYIRAPRLPRDRPPIARRRGRYIHRSLSVFPLKHHRSSVRIFLGKVDACKHVIAGAARLLVRSLLRAAGVPSTSFSNNEEFETPIAAPGTRTGGLAVRALLTFCGWSWHRVARFGVFIFGAIVLTLSSCVGHTLLCIVDWSTAKSPKHAYDNIYDGMLSRIEFSYITD
jgi:hypothetical protein